MENIIVINHMDSNNWFNVQEYWKSDFITEEFLFEKFNDFIENYRKSVNNPLYLGSNRTRAFKEKANMDPIYSLLIRLCTDDSDLLLGDAYTESVKRNLFKKFLSNYIRKSDKFELIKTITEI